MTCAAQAAEILAERVSETESLLDAGCGGGYYLHSFRSRRVPIEYHGLDYTPEMIDMARESMVETTGIAASRFALDFIEDLDEPFDNVVCFNVLTFNPHYGLPLDRLLASARKRILLRESMGDELVIRHTPDRYLDEGMQDLRVYHNMYPLTEVQERMEEAGFRVERVPDHRSGDGVEMSVDIPHQWRILVGERSVS